MKSVEPENAEGAGNPDRSRESDALATEFAPDRPEWDDKYFDRAAERLMCNYDLQWEHTVHDERFDLFGPIWVEDQEQFLHRSISCANHHAIGYMFARRVDAATITELERFVELGHVLTDGWTEPDEEHYGTELTFMLIADAVPEEVRAFVSSFADRTLLKFGYCGYYKVNLAIVASSDEDAAASRSTDLVAAFTPWSDDSPAVAGGLLDRLLGKLRR